MVTLESSGSGAYMTAATIHSSFLVIVAALLCALVCMVILHMLLRCRLPSCCCCCFCCRQRPQQHQQQLPVSASDKGVDKAVVKALPCVVYGLTDAADEGPPSATSECAICLGDFAKDEHLRVLPACRHCFHQPCIDTWLSQHSSCPTCRQPVLGLAKPRSACARSCWHGPRQQRTDTAASAASVSAAARACSCWHGPRQQRTDTAASAASVSAAAAAGPAAAVVVVVVAPPAQ